VQEVLHGKQIREEGLGQSRREHARDEARQVEERPVGQEGDQPQTGHRHRPVGGAARGRQGPVEEVVLEEELFEEGILVEEVFVFEEVILFEEVLLFEEIEREEVQFEEVLEEEIAAG
jgi:hypothetical protein